MKEGGKSRIVLYGIIKTNLERKVLERDAHIDEISRWTCPRLSFEIE